jgi:hypothetical protein
MNKRVFQPYDTLQIVYFKVPAGPSHTCCAVWAIKIHPPLLAHLAKRALLTP